MKRIVKTFLGISLIGITGAGISPLLISCANNNTPKVEYNETTKELNLDSSNFSSLKNKNIFSFFNLISIYKKNNNDYLIKSKIDAINNNLTIGINNWLSSSGYNELDIQYDINNISIGDNWTLIYPISTSPKPIPTNTENPKLSIDIQNLKIDFPVINQNELASLVKDNIYKQSASIAFPNKTLEQIQEMPSSDILKVLSNILPPETIIWNYPVENQLTSEIIEDKETGNRILKMLIFIPGSYPTLGTLELYYEALEVQSPKPTKTLVDSFGPDLSSDWPTISNTYVDSLEQINFSDVNSGVNPLTLYSYKDIVTMPNIKNEITKNFSGQNYLANFNKDLTFFLKNYFSDLSTKWENKNLLLYGLFVTQKIELKGDKLVAKLGIDIHNNSNGTRQITLPVSNEVINLEQGSILTLILSWNESDINPYLKQINKTPTAYLTTSFNNMSVEWFKTINPELTRNNNFLNYSTTWNTTNKTDFTTFENVFPVSYSMRSKVSNVGFGNDITSDQNKLLESYKNLTQDELKNTKLNEINSNYATFLEVFKSLQGILLKTTENPTVYDFLQSINSEIYDLVYVLTKDARIASIIGDVFSTRKLSEYLHNNIDKIIDLLKSIRNPEDPSMDIILDILVMIANNNATLEQKQEWVKSIEGLYPTLEKLLSDGLQWVMPLIKTLMQSISQNDPSIVNMLFSNTDLILSFIQQVENQNHFSKPVVSLVQTISKYLDDLISFSKTTTRNKIVSNPDKYKTIKVLDILAYELIQKNATQTSIFNVIIEILKMINPNSPVVPTIEQIMSIVGNQVRLPELLNDYSNSTFQNTKTLLGITYKVVKETITQTKLSNHLGKILKSLLYAKVGVDKKEQDLYSIFSNNINIEVLTNTFSFSATNKLVNQDLKIKYTLKETIEIDTLPLCVLVDNLVLGKSSSANYATVPNDSLVVVKPTTILVLKIGAMLPINLIIDNTKNFYQINYLAKDSYLLPNIDNKGQINWSYYLSENDEVSYKDILDDSNKLPTNLTDTTKYYYGSSYGTLLIGFKAIFNSLVQYNNISTKFTSTTTNLQNPVIIDNYNTNIILDGAFVKSNNLTNNEISNKFKEFIDNNGQWTQDATSKKESFSFKKDTNLEDIVNQWFVFSDLFKTNPYIKYSIGVDAENYTLGSKTYKYALVIKFNVPILYSEVKGSIINNLITQEIRFTVTSNTKPTPITPIEPPTPQNLYK